MTREQYGDATAERLIAHDTHVAHGVERDGHGRIGHRRKTSFDAIQLARHELIVEAHRVIFADAFELDRRREARTEPQAHEVLVVAAALPQPGGGARE